MGYFPACPCPPPCVWPRRWRKGDDLPTQWTMLNRLSTGVGRYRSSAWKWGGGGGKLRIMPMVRDGADSRTHHEWLSSIIRHCSVYDFIKIIPLAPFVNSILYSSN